MQSVTAKTRGSVGTGYKNPDWSVMDEEAPPDHTPIDEEGHRRQSAYVQREILSQHEVLCPSTQRAAIWLWHGHLLLSRDRACEGTSSSCDDNFGLIAALGQHDSEARAAPTHMERCGFPQGLGRLVQDRRAAPIGE